MAFTVITPNPTDVFRGEGVLYKNKGLGTETVVGALDGDTKFSVDRKFGEVKYNGAYGMTKDLVYKTSIQPTLDIKCITLNYTSMGQLFAGLTVTDEGLYHKVVESTDITASDYWTNCCYAGQRQDGKYFQIFMYNVLGTDKIEMGFKSDDNVVTDVKLFGCYDRTTPTTVPYEIRLED